MPTTEKLKDADMKGASKRLASENRPDSPVVRDLRIQAANAFVLYANYKHYHWQIYGPLFNDLHLLFDKLAGEVLGTLDELAERVRMIGQDPPAHLLEAAEVATIPAATVHPTVREMIEEANRHQLVVIAEMRTAAKTADEHEDPGSVDIFSRMVQIHEKHEWWTRDILRRGDGLCT